MTGSKSWRLVLSCINIAQFWWWLELYVPFSSHSTDPYWISRLLAPLLESLAQICRISWNGVDLESVLQISMIISLVFFLTFLHEQFLSRPVLTLLKMVDPQLCEDNYMTVRPRSDTTTPYAWYEKSNKIKRKRSTTTQAGNKESRIRTGATCRWWDLCELWGSNLCELWS